MIPISRISSIESTMKQGTTKEIPRKRERPQVNSLTPERWREPPLQKHSLLPLMISTVSSFILMNRKSTLHREPTRGITLPCWMKRRTILIRIPAGRLLGRITQIQLQAVPTLESPVRTQIQRQTERQTGTWMNGERCREDVGSLRSLRYLQKHRKSYIILIEDIRE